MVKGFAKLVKCALVLTCTFVLICGIATIAAGVWAHENSSFVQNLLGDSLYVSFVRIVIATGVIIAIISFIGCCGAIKENKCMLLIYFFILFMIIIIMLTGGILAYLYRKEVEKTMQQQIITTIPKYGNETIVTTTWDRVQDYFECCGLTTDHDDSYQIWRKKNDAFQQDKVVPESCCIRKDPESISACQSDPKNNAYSKDCYIQMYHFVKSHSRILGGIGIGIACFLMIGIILTCALHKMIK